MAMGLCIQPTSLMFCAGIGGRVGCMGGRGVESHGAFGGCCYMTCIWGTIASGTMWCWVLLGLRRLHVSQRMIL